MLTLRGLFKDGQITLLENVPFSGKYHVLITFLDTDDEVVIVPKAEHAEFMRATTKLTAREMATDQPSSPSDPLLGQVTIKPVNYTLKRRGTKASGRFF
jgi:hypothetical protein